MDLPSLQAVRARYAPTRYKKKHVDRIFLELEKIASQDVVWNICLSTLEQSWRMMIELPEGVILQDSEKEWINDEFRKIIRQYGMNCKKNKLPALNLLECIRYSPKALKLVIEIVKGKIEKVPLSYLAAAKGFLIINPIITISPRKEDLPPNLCTQSGDKDNGLDFNLDFEKIKKPEYNIDHFVNFFQIYPSIVGAARSEEIYNPEMLKKIEMVKSTCWRLLLAIINPFAFRFQDKSLFEGERWRDVVKEYIDRPFEDFILGEMEIYKN